MERFSYHSPTEVLFGKGAEDGTAELVLKHGGTKVYVVTGTGSVERSGLLPRIVGQLTGAGLSVRVFGGAKPNPLLSHARVGVAGALAFGADFILAVGGGSAIDTAKAIAHGAANPGTDVWDFFLGKAKVGRSVPVGVVLTIPAAGSETSNSAVITNGETGEKRGLGTELNRPRFAAMNPELAMTLPRYQVGCGVVDIMMHTMDRYFAKDRSNETTDEIAEAVLRVTVRNGVAAYADDGDYAAMSEVMWCGSLSHNGLTGLGGGMDFAVHQLGHELSGMFDVAHGASLSTMWGAWAEYCLSADVARFARFGRKVWGLALPDDGEAARGGIGATLKYFRSIGMPTNFTELGIGRQGDDVLKELADRCAFRGTRRIGTFKVLDGGDMAAIYGLANG
ncbi:MAG: iron-containing alcohol dehydrogenase [Oscillospiraceae bacterium]|nr:iron-containing alcohol dehydrogenase [Oscillospiraceae bacterium]